MFKVLNPGGVYMKKIAIIMTIILSFFLMSCAVDPSNVDTTSSELIDESVVSEETIRDLNARIETLEKELDSTVRSTNASVKEVRTLVDYLSLIIKSERMLILHENRDDEGITFQTSPMRFMPSMRISVNSDSVPEGFVFYESLDTRQVHLYFEYDGYRAWLITYKVKDTQEIENSDVVIYQDDDYSIIQEVNLSLDVIDSEQIEYYNNHRTFIDTVTFELVTHYEGYTGILQ